MAAPRHSYQRVVAEAPSCSGLVVGRAARNAMSPTLARRFPVGPGDGTPTRWYLHCPYCLKSLPDHLLSAVVAR